MKSSFDRRFIKRALVVLLLLICMLAAAWLSLRDYALHKVICIAEARFKTKYKAELAIKESSFQGFKKISFVGISLIPEDGDTLFEADTLMVDPSLTALLSGHLKMHAVYANGAQVHLDKNDSTANYDAFFHTKGDSTTAGATSRDYAAFANTLLKKIFYYLPVDVAIYHFVLNTSVNGKKETAAFSLSKHQTTMDATLHDIGQNKTWQMKGNVNPNKKTLDCMVYSEDDKIMKPIPFIETFTNAQLYFDTLSFSLDANAYHNDLLSLSGKISTKGLRIHQEKIAQDEVVFNQLSYDYHFTISADGFSADTASLLQINTLCANAGFSYSHDGYKEYIINLETAEVPANNFFSSLPPGMFKNFEGMNADGQLQYSFHFKFNTEEPDSLEFESSLTKENFHIIKYGVTDFAMLNGDFIYTAYEHDKPFRTINVSPSNPDFIPLQNIPDCFKNAVLTSEDGSFFVNNGFNESAFKKSIVEDYEAGKFVRGGSTITMQLVKNVFLSHHKTIARKAEEALIVWLIESNHLVSKERMMEIYLNIIELGPNVYGVSEAARFYFNKKASALTLPESIFLASLLPRPKWFKYCFNPDGTLKAYYTDYFRVVSNFLLKKNLITQDEYDNLKPEIKLEGPARNVVMPTDSVPEVEEDDE